MKLFRSTLILLAFDVIEYRFNLHIHLTAVCVCVFVPACVLAHFSSFPAPSKPTQTPQAMLGNGGVAMVTHKTITVRKPACFYSDDNGPIAKIQVIVAESGGMTAITFYFNALVFWSSSVFEA